jgi:hypothetical protein
MYYSLISLQTLVQGLQKPVAPMWHDCASNSFSSYNASTETIGTRGEIRIGVREGSGIA